MSNSLTLEERLQLLIRLGNHLQGTDEFLDALIHRTSFHNGWFTKENQQRALQAIARQFLDEQALRKWIDSYHWREPNHPLNVGIVMAGNIPLVGFHDLLCTFVSGHRAQVKLSDRDPFVLPYFIQLLGRWDERAGSYFSVVERLKQYDAVIATGSNNTARYFEAYFGKVPHIIRRNRHGVAVLTGEETPDELHALGKDVFRYFGLGCRNVSKLYVPRDYNFDPLLESLHTYNQIINHPKYKNNFDYNYALLVLNKEPFKSNGCVMLLEHPDIQSRISQLHYSYYDRIASVDQELSERQDQIQLVVSSSRQLEHPVISFGQAQEPGLPDYADGVDTLEFLLKQGEVGMR